MDTLYHLLHTALSFLVILSVIVFIHEFGHYLIARLCGVKIEVFSIGFGKEVFGFNDRSGTRWKFSALPLGGYVKMFGDESAASTADIGKLTTMSDADKQISFHYKPLWQKALVVFGGPLFNFLLTIGIFTYFIANNGVLSTEPVVGEVMPDSAAYEAGIKTGDRFVSMDGVEVITFRDISMLVATNLGEPITVKILRDGNEQTIPLTPKIVDMQDALGNVVKHPRIGIQSQAHSFEEVGFIGALGHSIAQTYDLCITTLKVLGQFITGQRDPDQLKGPIGIAQMSGQATSNGLTITLWFMALLSANLGLINLLPVPLLDGGHLLYYGIEAASGRPLAQKAQEIGFKIGFILLISLMAFTIVNDLWNIVLK